VRRLNLPFVDQIAGIPNLAITELKSLFKDARASANAQLQTRIIKSCLCRILLYKRPDVIKPRPEQIRMLFQLIYSKGDVLLIARTGFGKSIIFYAYTILTRLITLQLILLSKLSDKQLADIRWYPGTSPCLVDLRTKAREHKLLKGIAKGEYTYVLLGPEQALSCSFRKILRTIGLQAKFSLVALDKVYLIVN
jgi:superfamily II DNA helicase RecQ